MKYSKNDKITILLFTIGFSLLAFIPAVEDFLLQIILPLPLAVYWSIYIAILFGLYFIISFFKKKAFLYKFKSELKFKSSIKLLLLGAFIGLYINILNIYILGIFQMYFENLI